MAEPLIPTPIPPKPTGASPALKAARWAAGIVACVAAAAAFVGTRGCEQSHYASSLKEGERVETVIAGKTFRLEPALDPATQVLGLGKRTSIEPDGGMIFVFPFPRRLDFVMRDCPIPIDVAFLDNAGRVMTLYAMPPEPPQAKEETAYQYEERLAKYGSRFPCRMVVEVAGGTFAKLGVKEGDVIRFDAEPLKARAR